MEKFVPFCKLSKKERKKLNSAKRRDWNGLDPAPLELAAIHEKDGKHISYTVRCPMCWTYSGFSDTADKALVLWENGYRIRVEKEDGAR